jgi:hypothetical protein
VLQYSKHARANSPMLATHATRTHARTHTRTLPAQHAALPADGAVAALKKKIEAAGFPLRLEMSTVPPSAPLALTEYNAGYTRTTYRTYPLEGRG